MDTNTNYFLLLMDISNSTGLAGKQFNAKMDLLEKSLKKLNDRYREELVLPISISYGDEIAGLFNVPGNIFRVVAEVRQILHPLTTFRFTVIMGQIARISNDIRKVGGSVFKAANKGINRLKQDNRFCLWELGDPLYDKVLGSLCEISNSVLNDMSQYQRKVFDLYMKGHTQKQIALELDKYPQSVWNAVRRSKADYILEAEATVNQILDKMNKK